MMFKILDKIHCDQCGSSYEVRLVHYDYHLKHSRKGYLCQECIDAENDKDEDNYPLDISYSELAREKNK